MADVPQRLNQVRIETRQAGAGRVERLDAQALGRLDAAGGQGDPRHPRPRPRRAEQRGTRLARRRNWLQ